MELVEDSDFTGQRGLAKDLGTSCVSLCRIVESCNAERPQLKAMSGIWTTHIDPVTGMQYFYNMRYQVSKWTHQNTDFSYPPPMQHTDQSAVTSGATNANESSSSSTTTSSRVTSTINLKKRKGEGARIKLAVSRTKAGKHGRHNNTSSFGEEEEEEENNVDEADAADERRSSKRERTSSRSRSRSLSQEQEQKTPRSRYEEELMQLNKGIEGTKGYGGPLVK